MAKRSYTIEDLRKEGAGIAPDYTEVDGKLICSKCGAERLVGSSPFCPHGTFGSGMYDPFTPYIDPHILPYSDPRAHEVGTHPVLGRIVGTRIESREQRRQLMRENNIDWAPRIQGEGGTEF